jgi:hypothetical protein
VLFAGLFVVVLAEEGAGMQGSTRTTLVLQSATAQVVPATGGTGMSNKKEIL